VVGAFAVVAAAGGLLEEIETLGRTVRACAAWEPVMVSSVMLTAATTHTATATVAIEAPGLALRPSHLQLSPSENLANHVDAARRATRLRYATASTAVEEQRLMTCSRSSGGSGAGGSREENAARRRAPRPRSAQVWHCTMCKLTR
jgi:hypothetical protein